MSYFSASLTRILGNITQAELAAASGIPRSSIAQYASGDRGISISALEKLLEGVPAVTDQLELVISHLRDETPASHTDRVRIEPISWEVNEPPTPAAWEKDLDQAMQMLATKAKKDLDLRAVILDLERFAR